MQNSIINTLFVVVAWQYEKIIDMKQTSTHHEILFFANTSLASKQLTGTGKSSRSDRGPSAIEELEKACWDGILHEMFPEILGSIYPISECFLWQVLNGRNFLYINIGASPLIAEQDASIDPYSFAMCICEN
jgi:hypothetical protein